MQLSLFSCSFLLLAVVSVGVSAQPLAPGDYARTLDFGGFTREYEVHVPPGYTGSDPVPLVIDIHGFSSGISFQKAISGFLALSDVEGFVAVWPQGLNNAWNGGVCCSTLADDVGFLRALVAQIEADANIDHDRIYATGLSNGGAMAHRLACEAADLFAAVAPLAFPISSAPPSSCVPSRPIPVLTFMGLTDVLVPYNGGTFPSAQQTIDHWRSANSCGAGPFEVHTASGASYCDYDTSCTPRVEVGLCSITANSFGGQYFDGHILYLNPDYDLEIVAWNFLKRFRLTPPVPVLPVAGLAGAAGSIALFALRRLRRLEAARALGA
jgi:polyhydroxybutyrate depolymerase